MKARIHTLLRWSERYTKTDMVYFVSGNFWMIVGRFVGAGSGILLTIAFANLLPKESFGTYKYVLSTAGFLTAFSLSGLGGALTRSIARGFDGVMRPAFWSAFRWSLFGSAIGIVGAGYYVFKGNIILGASFALIACALPFLNAGGLAKSFLLGKKDFRRSTLYSIPRSIVSITIIVGVLLITDNILAVITAYFFVNVLLSLGMYVYATKTYQVHDSARTDPKIAEEYEKMMQYGKHFSVITFFAQIGGELDKILLWHFAGPVKLAIYTFASAPIRELRMIFSNVIPLAFPKFTQKPLEDVAKTLPFRVLQMLGAGAVTAVIYIIAAPFIFAGLFPQYMDAVPYTQILALLFLFEPKNIINSALFAHARIQEQYMLTASDIFLRIFLYVVLIPLFGIMGLIVSVLASEFATFLLLLYILKRMRADKNL